MFYRRKMLLASIVFTALFYKVTAESATLLDMAPDAIDDMYNGCRKEALEKFVHSGLLKQELNSSEEFQEAWSANSPCLKAIPGGTKEHMAALLAYEGDEDFSKTFDNAVQTMGGNVRNTYESQFHYKSLHFLLMDSMSLLYSNKCETVYMIREEYTAEQDSKVRFGKFTKVWSSYSLMKGMMDLDGLVIFNITSCFFIKLGTNICSEDTDMALLSPVEVFTVDVTNKTIKDEGNGSEYTAIVLTHSSLESTHNCYCLSRSPADVSSQWLVLMLVTFSLFFFN
ncbi:erythroblast NAD(P)(+)--arginine ADP-ribosyltransferase-like [Notothenia coriiceps]|uniref:NAD(P)(+)--arginine ADP-ribosyltransferase n=1 Tax=Notothenia coriiceps TaxID=8208 RepID=A0A6I9MSR2_9TELE|nr:PREDICTED: erythroblast NAD(P)(+)--arginine ADP-ribosyltransferase-like [Notothenia coriiceps]